jgi:hypothetical protein
MKTDRTSVERMIAYLREEDRHGTADMLLALLAQVEQQQKTIASMREEIMRWPR